MDVWYIPQLLPTTQLKGNGKETQWALLIKHYTGNIVMIYCPQDKRTNKQYQPVNHFPPPLLCNHVEEGGPEVVTDGWMSHNLVSEDDEPQVVYIIHVVLLDVHAVLNNAKKYKCTSMPYNNTDDAEIVFLGACL